jgi:flagellar hook-basal body complex protein FliE
MRIDSVSFFNIPELQKSTSANINANNVNFSDVLKDALNKVNDKQIEAESAVQSLITGDAQDIHQVMLSTEEANLTLELATQIRNKFVEAYQEISRIQM